MAQHTHAVVERSSRTALTVGTDLPIPLLATPSFSTADGGRRRDNSGGLQPALPFTPLPQVTVEWFLGFEFAVGRGTESAGADAAPEEHDTVKWELPIDVLPADPMHVPFRRPVATLAI